MHIRWGSILSTGLIFFFHECACAADVSVETNYPPKVLEAIPSSTANSNEVEVRILQRHGRAPIPPQVDFAPGSEEALLHEFDEVTIEWRSSQPVTSILLRLPERQDCQGSPLICRGYSFWSTDKNECKLRQAAKEVLPSDPEVNAFDYVGAGRVARCTSDNQRAADDPRDFLERSASLLQFHVMPGRDGILDNWNFLTILIRNPSRTPEGLDKHGNPANTFQLQMNSSSGVLISKTFKALEIRQAWICGYSDWKRNSACTADCGGGHRLVTRRLLHAPPPGFDPVLLVNCQKTLNKTESCNTDPCEIDCELGDWTLDGSCSRTCGGGVQTERRPVLIGPLGGGKPCARWSDDSRVRYSACNTLPCPAVCETPDEEPTPDTTKIAVDRGLILGSCSKPCGGGRRTVTVPAVRKDFGEVESCGSVKEEECNTQPCRDMDFLQVHSWLWPEVGKWYLVSLVFTVKEIVESFELQAPPDFQLAAAGSKDACLLMEHNFPRLSKCTLVQGRNKDSGPVMALNFSNPLEPQLLQKDVWYNMQFWVKHPQGCSMGIDPDSGVCKGRPGERDWVLTIHDDFPDTLTESTTGSYEIYANEKFASSASLLSMSQHFSKLIPEAVRSQHRVGDQQKLSLASLPGGALLRMPSSHR